MDNKQSEADRLVLQACQMLLLKWGALGNVGRGLGLRRQMFFDFQRCMELRESANILTEVAIRCQNSKLLLVRPEALPIDAPGVDPANSSIATHLNMWRARMTNEAFAGLISPVESTSGPLPALHEPTLSPNMLTEMMTNPADTLCSIDFSNEDVNNTEVRGFSRLTEWRKIVCEIVKAQAENVTYAAPPSVQPSLAAATRIGGGSEDEYARKSSSSPDDTATTVTMVDSATPMKAVGLAVAFGTESPWATYSAVRRLPIEPSVSRDSAKLELHDVNGRITQAAIAASDGSVTKASVSSMQGDSGNWRSQPPLVVGQSMHERWEQTRNTLKAALLRSYGPLDNVEERAEALREALQLASSVSSDAQTLPDLMGSEALRLRGVACDRLSYLLSKSQSSTSQVKTKGKDKSKSDENNDDEHDDSDKDDDLRNPTMSAFLAHSQALQMCSENSYAWLSWGHSQRHALARLADDDSTKEKLRLNTVICYLRSASYDCPDGVMLLADVLLLLEEAIADSSTNGASFLEAVTPVAMSVPSWAWLPNLDTLLRWVTSTSDKLPLYRLSSKLLKALSGIYHQEVVQRSGSLVAVNSSSSSHSCQRTPQAHHSTYFPCPETAVHSECIIIFAIPIRSCAARHSFASSHPASNSRDGFAQQQCFPAIYVGRRCAQSRNTLSDYHYLPTFG